MFWKARELNIVRLSWPIWMAEERDCRMPPSTSSSSIPWLAAGMGKATQAEQSQDRSESVSTVITSDGITLRCRWSDQTRLQGAPIDLKHSF